jgi:malate synthase
MPDDLELQAPSEPAALELLTADALAFLARLCRDHTDAIGDALARRKARQARYDAGELPDFASETRPLREADWRVAPLPSGLSRRVVEITGPTERRMIVRAMNSGADVFMADFEDATSPTWSNLVRGQRNVRDAARGTLEAAGRDGERLVLAPDAARLMMRPRGLHLTEAHVLRRGHAIPAALFDFGLFAWHSARALLERDLVPCLYLPKLESHDEAGLWDAVLASTERALGLDVGTIKVTVLIETLPAAFAMDEILHALRHRVLGLNCGRWDYMFSYVKTLHAHGDRLLPDRRELSMTQPFLASYARLLVKTCHRRGALALGGMAAQIPNKDDPRANAAALAAVREDKQREAREGHDGTWVAHPGLVHVARAAFDEVTGGRDHQLGVLRPDVTVTRDDLLSPPSGRRTEDGLVESIGVALEYLEAWLSGSGCVPIDGRMEDVATAEIARALVWQSVRHGACTDDGRVIDRARVTALLDDATRRLASRARSPETLASARELVLALTTDTSNFAAFSTVPAYARLVDRDGCPPPRPTTTKEQTA